MSRIFEKILELVSHNEIQVSAHGYDELAADDILFQEILDGVQEGFVVEDYPDFAKGPCVLSCGEFLKANQLQQLSLLPIALTRQDGAQISNGGKNEWQTHNETRARRGVRSRGRSRTHRIG